MSDCNDIRWALERLEKRQIRMESRQLGYREQQLTALLRLAADNDVVNAALGKEWATKVWKILDTQ